MPDKPIFPTPQDAEAAFYEAIEQANLDQLMQVWAEDEDIVCVHPGGSRIVGYNAIRETWRRIFEGGQPLQLRLTDYTTIDTPFASVHSMIQEVFVRDDESKRAPLVATNVFIRGAIGWRLVLHHVSPAPPHISDDRPLVLH